MKIKWRNSKMLIPTIILGIIALLLLIKGYNTGGGEHIKGLKSASSMLISVLPLLLFAFIIAGMAQTLISQEFISKWIGNESGLKGIMIGSISGALAPGGPFVIFPIAAGFFKAGAGVGTIISFLTGWSVWAILRIPMEIGFLGWKLTGIRLICSCFVPPLIGLIAHFFFGNVKS